jgi:3-dehydroquinate dehydratase type I
MKKKSFLDCGGTAVTMLSTPTGVEHAIALARTARDAGADGIALELNRFPVELRTVDNFRKIISSVQLPFMFTDYRCDVYYGADDEARMDTLMKTVEAGAEFVDVMADLYCPSDFEIATDNNAVARQIKTIEDIHQAGGKVVMSSHILDRSRTAEECMMQLRMEESRGADIVKLVTMMYTQEDFLEGVRCLMRLNREMTTPWIYLGGGPYGRMQRFMGPHFGCAVEFAVNDYMTAEYYDQPTVANFKKAMSAILWKMPLADADSAAAAPGGNREGEMI